MKKFLTGIAGILTVIPILYSCNKVEAGDVVFEKKEKTILVYMVSHNNLSTYAGMNISKMLAGYVPSNANLAVYCNNFDLQTNTLKDTLPLLINISRNAAGSVKVDTLYKFPYRNSATKATLASVLNITRTMLPADSYGLILWSHGTGWLPSGYYSQEPVAFRPASQSAPSLWPAPPVGGDPYAWMVKSFGEENGTEMPIPDVADAITFKLDFIALDACLMGNIETVYQFKGMCDYMLFSPAEILVYGYSYDTVIEPLFKADYAAAAKAVYDYYNSFDPLNDWHSVTMAAVDMSALDEVAAQSKIIFENHRAAIASLNMSEQQPYFRYNRHYFYDFAYFMKSLATASEYEAFETALNKLIMVKYTTGKIIDLQIDQAKFSGITSYINNPAIEYLDSYYKGLKWNKAVQMIAEE